MEHESNLLDLLRPLGVYDLIAGTVHRGELAAYGAGLDAVGGLLEELFREMFLTTAEEYGLERVEELLPYRPLSGSVEERRRALAALLRIGGGSATLRSVNDTLSGCGINALASEGAHPGCVEVGFPNVEGIPENFEGLRTIIEEILPCHLDISYVFWFATWGEVAGKAATWGAAEKTGKSWYELSVWR